MMQRPAATSLRYVSPVGSPFKKRVATPPQQRILPSHKVICANDRTTFSDGFSAGRRVKNTRYFADSPKVKPRLCLSKLDICRSLIVPSLVKTAFYSEDCNNLRLRDSAKHNGLKRETKFVETIFDLNSPTRESILDNGLDGLALKKPKTLGRGGFGVVLMAMRKGRKVAVKVITKRSARINSCEESLVSEENGVGLCHPNIVEILDIYGFRQMHAMVIMEFAGNRNLNELLEDPEELLGKERRLNFAHQVACAVSWCHRNNVAHLDIKPSNIIVNANDCCKITDFGCSRVINDRRENWHLPGGTVAYRAPELMIYCREPTLKADIYSLAITMWQILWRRIPFAGLDAHAIVYQVVAHEGRPEEGEAVGEAERDYMQLYHVMWVQQPTMRPSINTIIIGIKNLH